MQKISTLLEEAFNKLGFQYTHSEDKNYFTVDFELKDGNKLPLWLFYTEKSAVILLPIVMIKDLPTEIDEAELYKRLLEGSLEVSGAAYSVSKDGMLVSFTELDMSRISSVESVGLGIKSVITGYAYFLDNILPTILKKE